MVEKGNVSCCFIKSLICSEWLSEQGKISIEFPNDDVDDDAPDDTYDDAHDDTDGDVNDDADDDAVSIRPFL